MPLEHHSWLLDYYRVHVALVDVHPVALAGEAAPAAQLRAQVADFAAAHQFPFFNQVAHGIF